MLNFCTVDEFDLKRTVEFITYFYIGITNMIDLFEVIKLFFAGAFK